MELGAREVVAVVGEFSARLETKSDALDALNVFPVADNDTGRNMVHTLRTITLALNDVGSLVDAAERVEAAALDGRGNSGLIIGQFLAGFFSAVDGEHLVVPLGVARGAQWARRAVAKPVEGTMLTVADVGAAMLAEGHNLDAVLLGVAEAVEATPEQLPILAERGVVDSGAAGLLLFFEALLSVAEGAVVEGAVGNDARSEVIVCNVGLDAAQEPTASSFEIQFRVPVELVGSDELRELLITTGTDVVIASSAEQLAAHVHVSDPHVATAAISAALETRPGAKAINYNIEPIIESGPRS